MPDLTHKIDQSFNITQQDDLIYFNITWYNSIWLETIQYNWIQFNITWRVPDIILSDRDKNETDNKKLHSASDSYNQMSQPVIFWPEMFTLGHWGEVPRFSLPHLALYEQYRNNILSEWRTFILYMATCTEVMRDLLHRRYLSVRVYHGHYSDVE